ncbi:MAG: HAMP domain-containing histidine kinase [Verrucomicrobia bacterium]|nr:HAMP domain-containing histidine kinase [Verrucomicrobiota bacterium]
MFTSLRSALTLLWLFVVVVCGALAVQLYGLFQLGIGGQIAEVQHSVADAAKNVSQQYDLYRSSFTNSQPDFGNSEHERELLLLLDLALGRYNGIEGGFWSPKNNFIAYSFPTHQPIKRDVPAAESSRISELNQRVLSAHKEDTARYDSSEEVLLIHAIPVSSDLVIWTMGRAHVGMAAAFEKLAGGLVGLLLLMLVTGGVILWYLHTWGRRLSQVEQQLDESQAGLTKTGLSELDRLIAAFNLQTKRLQESQERSNQLSVQLNRADRLAALGRMSAGLAHEIRNPIGAMRLQAENALAKTEDENQQKTYRNILQEIARLDDLLERLLAIVRLDKLVIQRTQLRRWLDDCINRFRGDSSVVRLEVTAPALEWTLDQQQMTRALDNLVTNALRHIPPDGWVQVTAEPRNHTCYLIVEDSGPGIPEESRENIFEPFISLRSNGTGLGLAIAREIVEAHGGTISCTQGANGARFEIRLPWRES